MFLKLSNVRYTYVGAIGQMGMRPIFQLLPALASCPVPIRPGAVHEPRREEGWVSDDIFRCRVDAPERLGGSAFEGFSCDDLTRDVFLRLATSLSLSRSHGFLSSKRLTVKGHKWHMKYTFV